MPSATLAVYQLPNANALAGRDLPSERQMQQLAKSFPPGLHYAIVYNATNFVTANIAEIMHTLAITLVLVVAVVFVFLQDWRATLIPTIAIPVSLIGVFAVLYILGYSANTVDLFAIVLAITLVVDDAIVVVENVTRTLEEHPDMPVDQATEQAMAEITGPVIATTLVLVAVFAPVGFIAGVTGALYRQFAVTISVSIVISGHQCADAEPGTLRLDPAAAETWHRFPVFRWFNRGFDVARNGYSSVVALLSRRLVLASRRDGGVLRHLGAVGPNAHRLPAHRGPGLLLRQRADAERRLAWAHQAVVDQDHQHPAPDLRGCACDRRVGVQHRQQRPGIRAARWSLSSSSPGTSAAGPSPAAAMMAELKPTFNAMPSANIAAFDPPAIPGVGPTGGINFVLEARNGQNVQQLASVARALIIAANQDKRLADVFTGFSADQPQIEVSVNTTRAELLGVSPGWYTRPCRPISARNTSTCSTTELRLPGDRAGGPNSAARCPTSASCTCTAPPAAWCR